MKQTINFFSFREAFRQYDRMDNFPGHGLSVLFNFLEDYEDETGEEIDLDVIALCVDFSQEHWEDIAQNYNIDLSDYEDDEDKKAGVISYLQDNTLYVGEANDNELIYQAF